MSARFNRKIVLAIKGNSMYQVPKGVITIPANGAGNQRANNLP